MEVRKRGGGRDAAEEFKKWGPLVKGEDGKGSGREGVDVLVREWNGASTGCTRQPLCLNGNGRKLFFLSQFSLPDGSGDEAGFL